MNARRLRRMENGATLAFQVSPGQPVYQPSHITSGVTRPLRTTNLWRSDPGQPLPQWAQLTWTAPQTIAHVELTWAGHLLREIHATPPFFRDPQCVRDYSIEAWIDGVWQEIVTEKGNYQRHRRHALNGSVSTGKLRVVIHATNGDASAALYEMRCYA
jgi:glycerol kinase